MYLYKIIKTSRRVSECASTKRASFVHTHGINV